MDYPLWQFVQLAAAAIMFSLGVGLLKLVGRTKTEAPYVFIIPGYFCACAISNYLRYSTSDFTALQRISIEEYAAGTAWWCASGFTFIIVYVFVLGLKGRRRMILISASVERELLHGMSKLYVLSSFVLLLLILANPFRGRDYGVLSATYAGDLSVGGLMIFGFLALLLAALVPPMMAARPLLGLIFAPVSVALLLATGSKAIATVYLVLGGVQFWRARSAALRPLSRSTGVRRRMRAVAALLALSTIAAALLTVSVGRRYNTQGISMQSATAATVGRFTQQEVATMIYAQSDWRKSFSSKYVIDTALNFVPGFIWRGKPINPAYKINELIGNTFTAASPSLFGAAILAADTTLYWPLLIIIAAGVGFADRRLAVAGRVGLSDHLHWYAFYNAAMLFEGNFVIWLVQLVIVFAWREVLAAKVKQIHRRNELAADLRWGEKGNRFLRSGIRALA